MTSRIVGARNIQGLEKVHYHAVHGLSNQSLAGSGDQSNEMEHFWNIKLIVTRMFGWISRNKGETN